MNDTAPSTNAQGVPSLPRDEALRTPRKTLEDWGTQLEAPDDQSERDVPEHTWCSVRPCVLPGETHAACESAHGRQLQVLHSGQGIGRWWSGRTGHLRGHMPHFL